MDQIICGDAWSVLETCADNQFDLIVTDPPYGIGEANDAGGRGRQSRSKLARAKDYTDSDWDNWRPTKEVFDELRRVSKHQIIFGGNYFADYLPASPAWVVWDKDNSGDFADCELIWTSFRSTVRKFRYRWNGMLQENMKHKEVRYHPTQKPLPLMKWLIAKYAQPGDTILDPFMGSGTTLRAAMDLGHMAVGVDISPEYCEVARKRLAQGVLL